MARRILITGASIAGNAAAWWLGRHGFDVTVVERAPAFRKGGQNVDVRGVGREVLRRMGLERAALDQGTGEEGTAWIDGRGRVAAMSRVSKDDREGSTAEMEILRGDLACLLHGPAQEHATFRFGDAVERVEQDVDAVTVVFASGRTERYDAIVVAEGAESSTRERVFPGEDAPRWMDLTIAYLTIPRTASDDRMWRWYNAPGGRGVSLRPDRYGTTRAMLMLQKPPGGEQDWNVDRQKAWLHARFADAGWEAPRVLAAMDGSADFHLDTLRQVRMRRWSNGRVVLLGDAAWCATPLAGIGTTLAVTGAYILAGEMSRSDDVGRAFAAYEGAMRPMVERAHRIPKVFSRVMNPHSRAGIRLLHAVLHLASRPVVRALTRKRFAGPRAEPELPRYDSA